jgi:hypothetical protein
VHVGNKVLVRLLHDAAGVMQVFGALTIVPPKSYPDALALIDGNAPAAATAAWVGSLARLPILSNTDGEPTVVGRAVLSIPEAHADEVGERLGVLFEPDDESHFTLLSPDGRRTVHAIVTVADGRVMAEANSSSRLDTAIGFVQAALPGAEVLERHEEPLTAEFLHARRGLLAAQSEEDLPAGAEEAVAAFIAEYEERWCDESVPALGGLTPRQALDVPVARDDLIALLDGMEQVSSGPGTMDAARVRRLLGL